MSATRELQRRLLAEETQPRFEPCLPRPTKEPPSGPDWIHEIKHDGFRILAHRQGPTIRLITRNGYDFNDRFPFIVEAVAALPVRSCIVDGEAIAVDENGLSVFDLVRNRRQDDAVLLCAFDLLEVNGEDIRQDGIEGRKRRLAGLLRRPHDGMALNDSKSLKRLSGKLLSRSFMVIAQVYRLSISLLRSFKTSEARSRGPAPAATPPPAAVVQSGGSSSDTISASKKATTRSSWRV
jgi:hypothetical protein